MSDTNKIKQVIEAANKIVIIQADNPDGDSLGSAIALEHILAEQGKEPYLYCGVVMPSYLHYIEGWDRVSPDLPTNFDMTIIVDNSSMTLLESLIKSGQQGWVASKPCIILDHHQVEKTIPFATVIHSTQAVATCEVIYELAQEFSWGIPKEATEPLIAGLMSDSLGLVSEGTTARSIEIVSELVKQGASLSNLDAKRKSLMKKSLDLTHYKGRLLQRIELELDGRLAVISISWEEIKAFSHQFNPPMLVMEDMRMIDGVQLAIAYKVYLDGKITGKIRCNQGYSIAKDLSEFFGGGGHSYAAGFKVTDGRSLDQVKTEVLNKCQELLA